MFLNEVRNHAFGVWAAGAPLDYSTQLTQTALAQLRRTDPREHPNRVATGAGSLGAFDYIYEGPNSLRANIAAAAVIDDFRIWPFSRDVTNLFTVAHLGPFVVIGGVNDVILCDEAGPVLTATLTAGSYTATTLAAEIVVQLTAAGVTVPACIWDGINRHFFITSTAAAFNINWLGSSAAGLLGYTANDAGALTYESDVAVPPSLNCLYRAYEGKNYSFSMVARCSVVGNLMRLRIVGLDDTYTVSTFLNANGQWQAGAAFRTFQLSTMWRSFGVSFVAPSTVRYFLWQVSNGTAGAQLLDLGRSWWPNPIYQMSGEETRI